jgi:hypothetical protein
VSRLLNPAEEKIIYLSQNKVSSGTEMYECSGMLLALLSVSSDTEGKENFMLGTILLVVLILLLVGALPNYSYSRNWGYAPSGGLGLVVLILVILLLMGRI